MKKYFLTGLATMLPIVITIWFVSFAVDFLTRPFIGIVTSLLSRLPFGRPWTSEPFIRFFSEALILVLILFFIMVLGMVARWFFFNTILVAGEKVLRNIPFFKKIYKGTKDFIGILFSPNQQSFKQVVMVPFPYKGCYCLGLITREAPKTCNKESGIDLISVFIPTTPNPFTGFLVISPRADLIFMDMKSDEAIKYIVSCGVVQPAMREKR